MECIYGVLAGSKRMLNISELIAKSRQDILNSAFCKAWILLHRKVVYTKVSKNTLVPVPLKEWFKEVTNDNTNIKYSNLWLASLQTKFSSKLTIRAAFNFSKMIKFLRVLDNEIDRR